MSRRPTRRQRPSCLRTAAIEALESRQMLAAQVYNGSLSGKIVFTSGGHGWQWSSALGRYATDRGENNEMVEDSRHTLEQDNPRPEDKKTMPLTTWQLFDLARAALQSPGQ